jgi:hypothetical protein
LERKTGQLTMEFDLLKGGLSPSRDEQRALVDHLLTAGVGVARGGQMIRVPRSTHYRRAALPPAVAAVDTDAPLCDAIAAVRSERVAYGYRRVIHALRCAGLLANTKRVQRVLGSLLAAPLPRRR